MIFDNVLLLWFLGGVFLAGLVIIYYTNVYKNLFKKETLLREQETEAHQKAEKIMEHAHQRAEAIVREASQKATQMLSQSESFKYDIERQMKEVFEKTLTDSAGIIKENSTDVKNQYVALFSDLQSQYMNEVKKITTTLESESKKGLAEFESIVKTEITDFQGGIATQIDQQLKEVQTEIQTYKDAQMKTIETRIENTIRQLAKDLLGKSIPLEEHENLIFKALEKAKKEGMFS